MFLARDVAVRGISRFIAPLLLVVGASSSWAEPRPLRFGLWPYHSPQFLVNYYEDLRQHLETKLGRQVQLETAPSVEQFMQRTVRREYDVALIAAHLGRLAQIDYDWKPVAGYKGKNTVYVITLQDADIHNAADLKGKTIATQNRTMLMSLSARKWLKVKGLAEGDYQWLETGGLVSSVFSVVSGQADAGIASLASLSMSPQSDIDQLRIIGEAGNIPQLYLMASPSTKPYDLQVLRKASLDFVHEGVNPLALISDKDLRSLDEFAADGRSLLTSMTKVNGEQSRREKQK